MNALFYLTVVESSFVPWCSSSFRLSVCPCFKFLFFFNGLKCDFQFKFPTHDIMNSLSKQPSLRGVRIPLNGSNPPMLSRPPLVPLPSRPPFRPLHNWNPLPLRYQKWTSLGVPRRSFSSNVRYVQIPECPRKMFIGSSTPAGRATTHTLSRTTG